MVTSSPSLSKPWQKKPPTPSVLDALAEQEERIAARLRKLRADIGHPNKPGHPLPADKAAETANVKYRQWVRWEAGTTMPRSKNLEQVAAAFDLDLSEFYADNEKPALTQLDRIEQRVNLVFEIVKTLIPQSTLDAILADVVSLGEPEDESPPDQADAQP